ncbi:hypothetical protein [Micromonospora sp. NPDC047187]
MLSRHRPDSVQGVVLSEEQFPELTRMVVGALRIDVRADTGGGHDP